MIKLTLRAGLASFALFGAAHAEEGMWPLDNLPLAHLKSTYGFTPTKAWIDHVMHASARLTLGCSASFVSPDGLVMTNHHCAAGCLADLTTATNSIGADGYVAASRAEERKCPGMELDQLQSIGDVTARIDGALAGKSGAGFIAAERSAQAAIETECAKGDPDGTRCDVVTLYHGGRYALYRYRRFQDVRLSFSPQDAVANFGGDPDNFNFPRYDLDVTFLRAYQDGKPAHTDYFRFDPAGPTAGELVITSGDPGATERDTTAAELEAMHDLQLPLVYGYLRDLDGVVWEYRRQGATQNKDGLETEFGVENSIKVYQGRLEALGRPAVLAARRAQERAMLDWIDADPTRRTTYGDPFARVAATIPTQDALYARVAFLDGRSKSLAFWSELFDQARMLVRAAAEREKPDAQRLPAYRDAHLPAIHADVLADKAEHTALEETTLAFSLTKMRQVLGADDPVVHQILGRSSPDEVARGLVSGTHLADASVRNALWNGGEKVIEASADPMIRFARSVDAPSRAARKAWEDQVEAPQHQASELIAKARFARGGMSVYPDATFTERLSFGTVDGWKEKGQDVAPFTNFAGLFDRATGSDPFALPADWLKAKASLPLATPFDFVSTNDIIGGNSGSPMIDRNAQVVGLVFDGNIHSIAGNFFYDGTDNRAVSVDAAALVAALRDVYGDGWLADELEPKGRAATN